MINAFCCDDFTRAYQDYAIILDTGYGYFLQGRELGVALKMSFCPFCGMSFSTPDPDWEQRDGGE